MGRKSRYDRRNKPGSSSYGKKKWEDEPRRGRSPTRSPTPDRRRDESPYPRRQHRIDETRAQSPSPPRGRGYTASRYSPEYEGRPSSSAYARNISRSPSPLRRREYSRPPSEEYRRGERYTSVERPYISRASRSRSPSPSREKSTSKKFRNKKSRYEKKSIKSRDTDKYSKSSRRTHDVWKPGQKNGSPQPSRGRAWSPQDSSPQRSLSPSPRRDRPSTSGSGRPSYNSRTSISPAYDRPSRRQAPSELAQSSTSRYPPLPDQRDLYQEVRSTDYTRKHPPSQSSRHKSPIPSRKYEEYPSQDHDNRDYENRDYEKRRQERRKRPRGQDYSREEWEKTHDSRKRYSSKLQSLIIDMMNPRSRTIGITQIFQKNRGLPTKNTPRYPSLNILSTLNRETMSNLVRNDVPLRVLVRSTRSLIQSRTRTSVAGIRWSKLYIHRLIHTP